VNEPLALALGKVSRQAVMASAFSCNSMATERVNFGMVAKPWQFIHSPNSRL
jgi:hypothetical protein